MNGKLTEKAINRQKKCHPEESGWLITIWIEQKKTDLFSAADQSLFLDTAEINTGNAETGGTKVATGVTARLNHHIIGAAGAKRYIKAF